jgi:predicted nucleotidyltransferase
MPKKHTATVDPSSMRRYRSPEVPLRVIRGYARQVADRFHPDKIILFGSYAYGKPHEDSDVDLLVVMPCYNEINMAIRICVALHAPFSLDLIVRTPKRLDRDIRDNDWFLREIVEKGKTLYEAKDRAVDPQSRIRSRIRKNPGKRKGASLR